MKIPFSVAVVAEALDLTIGSNGQMIGLCPCHDDTRTSLSVKIAPTTGNLLTYCHAGCDQIEVNHSVVGKIKQYMAEHHIEIDSTLAEISASAPVTNKRDNIKFAQGIWHNADFETDIVRDYLKGRGLSGDLPDSIRQANLEYTAGSGQLYPCMIAEITDANLNFTGIHRTFLTRHEDDRITKALVEAPKKILGCMKGNHVALSDDYRETLHLAEGIETGLSVRDALSASVWACLSAQNLASIIIPDDVETVFIWADKDLSGTGQKFAEIATKRLTEEGKKVYILTPDAAIPEGTKSVDWNDMGKDAIAQAYATATQYQPTKAFPYDHLRLPAGYVMDDQGVMFEKIKANGEVQKVLVATGPIWLSGKRTELITGETEIEISWQDLMGSVHSRWLSRGHAFRGTTILDMSELASFPVFDGINRETVKFLALMEKCNRIQTELIARKPGWNTNPNGKKIFIRGIDQDGIRLHPEPEYKPYASALSIKGSFDEWLNVIRPAAERFPLLLFALLTVLTPPLLRIITGASNFLVDFWGKTSCGKTSLLQVISSAWGKPSGQSGLILSWNNTTIFAERIASFFGQGLPLFFDDSQTASDKTIESITYMVANGVGRGRAKPYSIKDVDRFQVVSFTTGEKPLTEKSYPGAKSRTIGVHGSPFPDIDPIELQNLKSAVSHNYGHLSNLFINALMQISHSHLMKCNNEWHKHYTNLAENEIGNRFAGYFALITVVGEILINIPKMHWINPIIFNSLNNVWDHVTADFQEIDMAQKALHGIAGWIDSNQRHFAVPGIPTELQPTYGMIRRDDNFVAIIPHIFQQALRDIGIQSQAAVLAEWKKQGFLLHHPARNQRQVKVEGQPIWCICIKRDALFPATESDGAVIVPPQIGQTEVQSPLPN